MCFPDKIFYNMNKSKKQTNKQKQRREGEVFYSLMHWHSEFKFDSSWNVKEWENL